MLVTIDQAVMEWLVEKRIYHPETVRYGFSNPDKDTVPQCWHVDYSPINRGDAQQRTSKNKIEPRKSNLWYGRVIRTDYGPTTEVLIHGVIMHPQVGDYVLITPKQSLSSFRVPTVHRTPPEAIFPKGITASPQVKIMQRKLSIWESVELPMSVLNIIAEQHYRALHLHITGRWYVKTVISRDRIAA